jgi:hypothetical protein
MRKEMERDKNRVFSPSAGIPEISWLTGVHRRDIVLQSFYLPLHNGREWGQKCEENWIVLWATIRHWMAAQNQFWQIWKGEPQNLLPRFPFSNQETLMYWVKHSIRTQDFNSLPVVFLFEIIVISLSANAREGNPWTRTLSNPLEITQNALRYEINWAAFCVWMYCRKVDVCWGWRKQQWWRSGWASQ